MRREIIQIDKLFIYFTNCSYGWTETYRWKTLSQIEI